MNKMNCVNVNWTAYVSMKIKCSETMSNKNEHQILSYIITIGNATIK